MISTSYLRYALDQKKRARVIDAIVEKLSPIKGEYAIAFTGMSGSLIAPSVADRLGKPIICVRKSSDSSHSPLRVEGYLRAKKYYIIDDFIHLGYTVENIVSAINSATYPGPTLEGLILYNGKANVGRNYDQFRLRYKCPILALNTKYGGRWK